MLLLMGSHAARQFCRESRLEAQALLLKLGRGGFFKRKDLKCLMFQSSRTLLRLALTGAKGARIPEDLPGTSLCPGLAASPGQRQSWLL